MNEASLRARLKIGKIGLLEKYSARLDSIEGLRLWMVGVGVVGAFTVALSKAFEGGIGVGLAIAGAISVAIGGLVVARLDYRKLEIVREAKDAHDVAEQALDLLHERGRAIETAETLDRKRRERLLAIEQMLEAVEIGLIKKRNAAEVATIMLSRSIAAIRKAIDYEASDFLTVTIFQKMQSADGEEMCRIGWQWTDPAKGEAGGRSWKLGQGYTGSAWNNALVNPDGDVIEADTHLEHCRKQYPVENSQASRENLYRSVAAIPILVGATNEVWGVVTATSDRSSVFQRDTSNVKVQNVDMIRDVARIAALLAGLEQTKISGWFGTKK